MWGGALKGVGRQVLEALGSFWKEFSANGNEDSQSQGRSWSALPMCHGLCWLASVQGHHRPQPSPHWGPLTSGTSCPFSMISDSILPLAEPELNSARRRSPVERWV